MAGHRVTVSTTSTRTGSTLRLRRVELYFVRSPGAPGTSHGIDGIDWSLFDGTLYVDFGTTDADGKITVNIAAGRTYHLEVLGTDYEVYLRNAGPEAIATVSGQQRRLRMLGYQIGHTGTGNNGIDGSIGRRTDRAIQQYQVEKHVRFTGRMNRSLRTLLTTDAGT